MSTLSPMQLSLRSTVATVLVVGIAFFSIGINWGLPSRQADPFLLHGDNHIEQLTDQVPPVDASRGADVVTAPGAANQIVPMNDTDAKRAQIFCRYRLYSYQPDEMITFRSLSQMKPRQVDFDPRLYQYGGLWIYGVGALIEIGHLLGLLQTGSRSFYIDHPETFAQFYIVARAYSAAFGLVGVWAVFALVRRITGGLFLPAVGALCFIMMPVVIVAAHEAKPHLAATALILLALLAADRYIQNGGWKWICLTGVLCGCAMGMVLWGAVALIIIPVMALQRRALAGVYALAVAGAVYALTNPYVIYHLLFSQAILRSNLGNTSAMYHLGPPSQMVTNAFWLIVAGCSVWIFCFGFPGLIAMAKSATGRLCIAVALAAAIPFILNAAGKPGEYARFAIVPDALLVIGAAAQVARLNGRVFQRTFAYGLVLFTAYYGFPYVAGFIKDASDPTQTTRLVGADKLQAMLDDRLIKYAHQPNSPKPTLAVYADPAPYCLSPVDLMRWDIIRVPKDFDATSGPAVADVFVRPDESVNPLGGDKTPMSWANKLFIVNERTVEERLAYHAALP